MRTMIKRNCSFGCLLLSALALGLTAAACSDGKDDPANDDPVGGCPDDLAFFEANLWKPIMSQKCVLCHSATGLAQGSHMVLKPPSEEGYLEHNLETVKKVAALDVDGTSILLLRPSGRHPAGHPGGTLVEFNSPDYKMFATFVDRVTKGKSCDAEVVNCDAPDPGGRLLRRLSRAEYDATIHDLFNIDGAHGEKFTADTVVKGFDNNAAALRVSPLLADQVRQAAEDIAKQVMTSPGSLLPCDAAKGDAACAKQFIDTFGKRAFRRPLTDADRARYLSLYEGVAGQDGFTEGIKTVLAAVLQSPHFLYRTELGDGAADKGVIKLAPYEIASELSYFIWGSMPDAELFAAADTGALSSPDEIEKQARRLLADPRSDAVIERFVDQWLEIDRLPTVAKDSMTYPEFNAAARAALREETKHFVRYVVRQSEGTLPELLTASYSFLSPELAKFYGVSAPSGSAGPDGFAKVDFAGSSRAGILTQGSVIATHSKPSSSSPIHRGKLVRERLLCQELPPPPPGLNVQPPALDPSLTTRERYAAHATVEPCMSCHTLIDPIGFGFERFDGIGRTRDTEGGKSIDATGSIVATESTNGDFDGTGELTRTLAESPDVHACFTTQWLRFSYGVEENAALSCFVKQVNQDFEKGGLKIEDLVVALTRTAHFTTRSLDGSEGSASGGPSGEATSSGSGADSGSGPSGSTGAGGGTGPGPTMDLDIQTAIDSQWETGYQQSVKVTNLSSSPITWSISLDVAGKITDLWNAVATPAGAKTTFKGKDYNAVIEPQGTASFGFVVTK
jgi:hypothetical protein